MPCEYRQFQRARCVTAGAHKRSSITLADGQRPASRMASEQGKQWAASAEEGTGHGWPSSAATASGCVRGNHGCSTATRRALGRRITGRGRVSRASHGALPCSLPCTPRPAQRPALSTASPPAPHLSYHHHPASSHACAAAA